LARGKIWVNDVNIIGTNKEHIMHSTIILLSQFTLILLMGAAIAYGMRDAFHALRDYLTAGDTQKQPAPRRVEKAAFAINRQRFSPC
jgi:hypothetical protein